MPKQSRPNIFDYATKELSQDAMICWLLDWADDRHAHDEEAAELHGCGRALAKALLNKHGGTPLPEKVEVKILQQEKYIDVLAQLDQKHVLLIEDKTSTSDHGKQLKRYYRSVVKGETQFKSVAEENVYSIFLKTGNQSAARDREIEADAKEFHRPFKVFNRREFLEVLDRHPGKHPTLLDYREYLRQWEERTNSFFEWRVRERCRWSWSSWEGFFRHLESSLESADWGYVPNPSGGFLGFWWKFARLGESGHGASLYLQLEVVPEDKERQKLCFKIGDAHKEHQQDLKWHWNAQVIKAGRGLVERPKVLRAGWTMTVRHWSRDWLAFVNGGVDLPETIRNLKEAEAVLEKAVQSNAVPECLGPN